MGRTNPTFRNVLTALKRRWATYRRALRRQDVPHFDRLFEHADEHADAAGYLNPEEPMHAILLSMLLEHEKQLAELADAEAGADNRVGAGLGVGDGGKTARAADTDAHTDATDSAANTTSQTATPNPDTTDDADGLEGESGGQTQTDDRLQPDDRPQPDDPTN